MPLLKILLPFLFFFASPTLLAQKNNVPDSLKMLSYKDIVKRYYKYEKDSLKTKLYAKAYLEKGKAENNFQEIFNGYHFMSHSNLNNNLKIIYMDSMVFISKKNNNNQFIAKGYFIKGNEYNKLSNYVGAIDNYLLASNYVEKTEGKYLSYTIKFNIAVIRSIQGLQEEAVPVFLECQTYFSSTDYYYYLNCILGLSICYNKMGQYDLSSTYNDFGIKESVRFKDYLMKDYFTYSEGMNQYSKKNFAFAIKNLLISIPSIVSRNDKTNLAIAYFYLGKSYYDLNQEDEAVKYFLKVDKIFDETNDVYPDLREGYEMLINYYKSIGDTDKQLFYIEKLLRIDKLLTDNFKYFSKKIIKEYDSNQLRKEKKSIEESLKYNKLRFFISIIFLGIFLVIAIMGFILFYKKQKNYKYKYESLMNNVHIYEEEKNIQEVIFKNVSKITEVGIPKDTVSNILKELEGFEQNKLFLQKDLTLAKLANSIQTNSSYLSKVVNTTKDKNFTSYINDLRIEYIVEALRINRKYRRYTIKALAEEIGFNNAESFSKAFYSKTGIYPSYFINKLKSNELD